MWRATIRRRCHWSTSEDQESSRNSYRIFQFDRIAIERNAEHSRPHKKVEKHKRPSRVWLRSGGIVFHIGHTNIPEVSRTDVDRPGYETVLACRLRKSLERVRPHVD